MKALLLKDWTIIKGSKSFLFPLFFLAGGITADYGSSQFMALVPVIFSYYYMVNLNAYDYKYNANSFLLSFPIDRKTWVASKYVIGILTNSFSLITLILVRMPFWIRGVRFANILIDMTILITIHSMSLIYLAMIHYGYFRLGYLKMRIVNFIAIAVVSVLNSIFIDLAISVGFSTLNMILFLIVSLGIYYLSYKLSVVTTEKNVIL